MDDVKSMQQGVAGVSFNVFDRTMAIEWHTVVHTFHERNTRAKKATRDLINTSFRRLRSAEGAFELLQKFRQIKSKGAIKEQMESKLQDILKQFSREIDAVADIFEAGRCAAALHQRTRGSGDGHCGSGADRTWQVGEGA